MFFSPVHISIFGAAQWRNGQTSCLTPNSPVLFLIVTDALIIKGFGSLTVSYRQMRFFIIKKRRSATTSFHLLLWHVITAPEIRREINAGNRESKGEMRKREENIKDVTERRRRRRMKEPWRKSWCIDQTGSHLLFHWAWTSPQTETKQHKWGISGKRNGWRWCKNHRWTSKNLRCEEVNRNIVWDLKNKEYRT